MTISHVPNISKPTNTFVPEKLYPAQYQYRTQKRNRTVEVAAPIPGNSTQYLISVPYPRTVQYPYRTQKRNRTVEVVAPIPGTLPSTSSAYLVRAPYPHCQFFVSTQHRTNTGLSSAPVLLAVPIQGTLPSTLAAYLTAHRTNTVRLGIHPVQSPHRSQ